MRARLKGAGSGADVGSVTAPRRTAAFLIALLVAAPVSLPRAAADAPVVRAIHFPVEGAVRFREDFGDPRVGHTHQGNDLMGERLQPLLSTVDGVVTKVVNERPGSTAGNYLVIEDAEGWEYRYLHVNNDTPGTDDNTNPAEWRFAVRAGQHVARGQHVAWMGDSGNAESTAPHLHFEIRTPGGAPISPWQSLRLATNIPDGTACARETNPRRLAPNREVAGYWHLGGDGTVLPTGDAPFQGSGGAFAVGMAAAPGGYRTVNRAGSVSSFDVPALGDLSGKRLNADVVGMTGTPAGDGYWLLGRDGGVFSFGAARFFGSTGAMRLNQPVVAMASTPTGRGYWLVARDGGVFTFGTAPFLGSTGAMALNEPIVDAVATPSGGGYWLLARDGGIFAFGDAPWLGSVPGTSACGAVEAVSITASPSGLGYWVQLADGRVFPFGDAPDLGDAVGRSSVRIVDFAIVR
jgi:hypothetical protein